MNFKEVITNDISKVFINFNEFGTKHTLNGREINCVIDEDKFQLKESKEILSTEEGVMLKGMTVYINSTDLKATPHSGEKFKLDDIRYEVLKCKEDFGVYEIDLVLYEEI